VDQRRRRRQLARKEVHVDALAERKRELAERARLASELDVPLRDRLPPRVVPEMHGRHGCQPLPTQLLGRGQAGGIERALRPPQDRHGSLIALAEEHHQAVEQQVGSARHGRRWCRARSLRHVQGTSARRGQASREHRR
jgi:hypothetical protein